MNHPPRATRAMHAARRDLSLLAWPLGLLVLLVLLASWRHEHHEAADARADAPAPDIQLAERRVGAARIRVPRSWVPLGREADHATWGTANRSHTVTLASVESTAAPLPAVVAAVAADAASVLPGARSTERPVEIDLGDQAPRDDTAMLLRLRVEQDDDTVLHVVQVWRRDSRAGLDLVATWTSSDGRWPRSPRSSIPRADASG